MGYMEADPFQAMGLQQKFFLKKDTVSTKRSEILLNKQARL